MVAPPEAALSWILVLTMSIGWMQIVAKQPDADPIKKGLQAARIGLSNLTSKDGTANEDIQEWKDRCNSAMSRIRLRSRPYVHLVNVPIRRLSPKRRGGEVHRTSRIAGPSPLAARPSADARHLILSFACVMWHAGVKLRGSTVEERCPGVSSGHVVVQRERDRERPMVREPAPREQLLLVRGRVRVRVSEGE